MTEPGTERTSEVARLLDERAARREARDFAAADSLRERIRELGFEVIDGPSGATVVPLEAPADPGRARAMAADVTSVLDLPVSFGFSVQWVVQGWPEDAVRGIGSFRAHQGDRDVQYVVVDASGTDPSIWPEGVEVISLQEDAGWGADRNAGLHRAAGSIVVVVDGSVEVTGDVFGRLGEALSDETVGVSGPFGISTRDMRAFEESPGPEVDAIEGYLMAFRRELLEDGEFFDEKFRFYRSADIEYSFRIRSRGLRALVVPLPVVRHEHRMWNETEPGERERLSKRNFYRFLERWRDRGDLIVGPPAGPNVG